MASIYDIMTQMSSILTSGGYTVYDVTTYEDKELSQISQEEFPVIFIGRQIEDIIQDAETLHILTCECPVDLNIVLNTGSDNLYKDCATVLRDIKNILSVNKTNCDFWVEWYMDDNYVAKLNGSGRNDKVYGGININTIVTYREEENTNL